MKTSLACLGLFFLFFSAQADSVGVRIRFGLTDDSNTRWDGTVNVRPGRVALISGWRFEQNDAVQGTAGWKAATRPATANQPRTNNPNRGAQAGRRGRGNVVMADNGVILSLEQVTRDSVAEVQTVQGKFDFRLTDIPYGKVLEKLDGAVEIERTAFTLPLTSQKTDDDFPAVAAGPDGAVYLAYVSFTPGLERSARSRAFTKEPEDFSYLATPPGGDQIWLRTHKGGIWSEPQAVTPGKGDIYKCAVTVDGKGRAWVIWSENKEGNFDIWARAPSAGQWPAPQKLSMAPGNDICPVAATDAAGHVWVAWQGARDGVFQILARRSNSDGQSWGEEIRVSTQSRNCWAPAIAAELGASGGGRVAIAWDTYDKGDYDVWVREFGAEGQPASARPAANTPDYEARPCLAYDRSGSLWIAWEESGPTWGKNWGALVLGQGIPLYQDRQIGLRVLQLGKWMEPVSSHTAALPGRLPRRRINAQPVPALEPEGETRQQAAEARSRAGQAYNNLSRLAADRDGRIWLLTRSRANDFRGPLGSVWMEYAAYYENGSWTGPILVPHSVNLLYNVPAAAAAPDGGLLLAHSTDHRQDRQLPRRGPGGNASLESDEDPFVNDIYVSHFSQAGESSQPKLRTSERLPEERVSPSAATVKELEEVARSRAYRAVVNGKELRLLRGEFHRHTEISGDGGNDGPLEDMWRYSMDVALQDWIGNGDHDNGAGREYPWWLTQKTTDAFRIAQVFEPVFSYERSVRYPEGHRNVIFAQRGVRTLPRLPITNENDPGHAPDTQMLYKYLRKFGGVCAVHTSATNMGTDWRDNDPEVEPFVEIYQGCRQNYERPGAPRCPTENDAIGGWRPKGFVNLALLRGYRLSFQASSDHRSTHISYCIVYAEDTSREALVNGIRARHTYGATDNIIADVRSQAGGREYMMGDEFSTSTAPALKVHLHGTAPFAKIVLIKDDEEVHVASPNQAKVDFTWSDSKPVAGKTSYYYVRGEQADGELVWASPMWIKYEPGQ